MVGRLITVVAVIASLVAFIAEATNKTGTWIFPLDRASYVLAVLAILAALLSARDSNVIVLAAQLATAATAVAFVIVALVKYHQTSAAFGGAIAKAYPWANEAQLLAVAALAFALTRARRPSVAGVVGLLLATLAAVGSAIYAITQKESFGAELWWWVAIAAAFLAASAAATLEREGTVVLEAPVVEVLAAEVPVVEDPTAEVPVVEDPTAEVPVVEDPAEWDAPEEGSAAGDEQSDPGTE